jgi:serine/threonine-protein kinase HipA
MQVFGRAPRGEQKYESTYEELSTVADALLGEAGYEEVIKRLALILGQGNNDAHLKNWSLVYKEPGTASLAPVYDQVATVAWTRLDRGLALKLAGAREFSRVNADSFGRLAHKVGRDPERTMELTRTTLVDLQRTWETIVRTTPLPPDHGAALVEHWNRVPLLRDVGGLIRK